DVLIGRVGGRRTPLAADHRRELADRRPKLADLDRVARHAAHQARLAVVVDAALLGELARIAEIHARDPEARLPRPAAELVHRAAAARLVRALGDAAIVEALLPVAAALAAADRLAGAVEPAEPAAAGLARAAAQAAAPIAAVRAEPATVV